jgi:hypothetical protein
MGMVRFPVQPCRCTVLLLVILVLLLGMVESVAPGIKAWDSLQMWENSALRNVWTLTTKYLSFRSYALGKMSDVGWFDHLLGDLSSSATLRQLCHVGLATGVVVVLRAASASSSGRSRRTTEGDDDPDEDTDRRSETMESIKSQARAMCIRLLRKGPIMRVFEALSSNNVLEAFIELDNRF